MRSAVDAPNGWTTILTLYEGRLEKSGKGTT